MQKQRTPLFRSRFDRNPHGKGWVFRLHLRKGAGYRAFDLPGHSNNVAHRFRKRLYIHGYTLTIATNQKAAFNHATSGQPRQIKRLWINLTRNGNSKYFPAWW